MFLFNKQVCLFNVKCTRVLFSASVSSVNSRRSLSFRDIPRAPSFPFVGSLLHILKKKPTYFHEYIDDLHKKLGPIFIDKIWDVELVHIADPDANFELYTHEGKEPLHAVPDMWKLHSEFRNYKRGLFFMDGKEWRKARTPINLTLSKRDSLGEHVKSIASITEEFIDTWKYNPPKDLKYHLYCWNVECIGSTALGMRLGFLDKLKCFNKFDDKHVEEDLFARNACNLFPTSGALLFKPVSLYKLLRIKSWRLYCEAADAEIHYGEKCVTRALKEFLSGTPSESTKHSMMYKLYQTGELDVNTIRRIFVEIFLASAGSTSNAAVWVLYSLGRNPKVAERVRQEISSVSTEELTLDTFNSKLPYLSGVIRESLRIYPITAFINRILTRDAEMCGYHIPAGTFVMASMYTMGRNPAYFPYPDSFMPERWQPRKKSPEGENLIGSRRAYSPFALGGRSCPGKNVALLDLKILVFEALKAYEWTTEEVGMIFNLVTMPSKKVDLILKPLTKTE
ncbi:cytochrome, mitochondrial [Armadillidium vulgare]|nr:cytochrome, mitochondrial [Armadillidium vulgare]